MRETDNTPPADYVFIGPYVCHVDRSVKVPEGEEGLLFMREFLRRNGQPRASGGGAASAPFTEGFVGFVSYDLGEKWMMGGTRQFSGVPEAYFVYVDEVAAAADAFLRPSLHAARPNMVGLAAAARNQYFQKLARIKEYLYAGETYQVNFSHKFETPYDGGAFELYQKLTAMNPSPYQFFMETKDWAVISNSPERLFFLDDGIIQTRPMKGTVPRGRTPQEDKKNVAALLASEKDRAELAMIVDLERHDLGKICASGTVEVTEDRAIEKYSHVIHTVSNIRGELAGGRDWYDALHALFPGGSITGAPKKRTMEIIRELEEEPRGVYCGSAGWIDLSGACDFNIMIRTLWYDKNAQCLTYRSGGGIVVDSDPQKEYEETLHKAGAIMDILR